MARPRRRRAPHQKGRASLGRRGPSSGARSRSRVPHSATRSVRIRFLSNGQTFAYGDQLEATPPLGSGSVQGCVPCSPVSSGTVPGVSGKTYTVTYYVEFIQAASLFGPLPPACWNDAGSSPL